MDLQAAESDHLRDPRDQISYRKTNWKCPCNGCKKAEKRERERIASLIQEQHISSAAGKETKFPLRMAECMTNTCKCYSIIDMIMEDAK